MFKTIELIHIYCTKITFDKNKLVITNPLQKYLTMHWYQSLISIRVFYFNDNDAINTSTHL